MPVITALDTEARSGGVRLQVDGAPFATVAVADLGTLALRLGAALDESRRVAIERRAEVFSARTVAVRMLAGRSLPSGELARRLVRRGHARAAAEAAVAELVGAGLIDDLEFAREFASTRARRQRYGRARLVRELRRFGIPPSSAEAAVSDAFARDGLDAAVLLREAAARKLRGLAGRDPARARRSLRQYLMRRGFAASDVVAYLREMG